MHALLLSALLLGPACAAPIYQDSQNPEDPFSTLAIQNKVHEKLSKPKQWSIEAPVEVDTEFSNEELAIPAADATTDEQELDPDELINSMDWGPRLGDSFRDFMSTFNKKHASVKEGPIVSKAQPNQATDTKGMKDQTTNPKIKRTVSQRQKRSVTSRKFEKKEPTPEEEPEDVTPEAEEATTEPDNVEITNEDFDELFAYYADKHDTRGFQSLQGYLDNLMRHGTSNYKSKVWKPSEPSLTRRDRSATSRNSWTPDSDKKPAVSINPEVFNRIAADYKFDQNPTTINVEDNYHGRSSAPKISTSTPSSLATQPSRARGKSSRSSRMVKRSAGSVVPCSIVFVGERIQGHGCESAESFFEALDLLDTDGKASENGGYV